MDEKVLYHHGIKGQKWGVRRFQNFDGSLTQAGKARLSSDKSAVGSGKEKQSRISSETMKKVGKAALIGGGVALAAYAYANNATAVNNTIAKLAKKAVNEKGLIGAIATDTMSDGFGKTVATLGKDYVEKVAPKIASKALNEIIKPAAKKVAIGAAQGVVISATTKALESTFGKQKVDAAKQAYNAYNKKNKIGKVPDIFEKGNWDEESDED